MKTEYLTIKDGSVELKLRYCYLDTSNPHGKDKTVVLLPGYLGDIDERYPLAKSISKYFNVILYEPRGYGKSDAPRKKGIYTIEAYARELREVLRSFNLKDGEFAIWGSCLATAPMHYYASYLEDNTPRPAAMIMASPAPKYREAGIFNYVGWMPNWLLIFFQKIVLTYLYYTRNKNERKNIEFAKRRFAELDTWAQHRIAIETICKVDLDGKQEDIPFPLLILASTNDDFVDITETEKYLKRHPLSEQHFFEHPDHKFIEGKEDAIAEVIYEFLSKKIWPELTVSPNIQVRRKLNS